MKSGLIRRCKQMRTRAAILPSASEAHVPIVAVNQQCSPLPLGGSGTGFTARQEQDQSSVPGTYLWMKSDASTPAPFENTGAFGLRHHNDDIRGFDALTDKERPSSRKQNRASVGICTNVCSAYQHDHQTQYVHITHGCVDYCACTQSSTCPQVTSST